MRLTRPRLAAPETWVSGTGTDTNGGAPGTTTVMIDRSAVVNNSTGIVAALGGGVIRIGDSTVTGNVTGLDFFDSG